MLNFGKFLTNNAITFDLTEIEGKKISSELNFVAHPMLPSKMSKSQGRDYLFFTKIFLTKSSFFQNVQIFFLKKIYFRILNVRPVILTTY